MALEHAVYRRLMELELTDGRVQAEYVWLGGKGPTDFRCKTRTLPRKPSSPSDCPDWNFDGSSTGQAPGEDSEVILRPVKVSPDPMRGGDHVLVLCACYTPAGEPVGTNTRDRANAIFARDLAAEPWYGIEQEYTLFDSDPAVGGRPLGFPAGGFPQPQGPYYCGAGKGAAHGRGIVEAHYRACLYAGFDISGINAEVMAGQWEYQVGPSTGIDAGDQLTLSRYLLVRICEEFGVYCSFDPKPMVGDWNGAGCHTNYSTKPMREEGGYDIIVAAVEKLGAKHAEHIAAYGEGNERRLTGKHETASMESFSYGVANRGASVRIPRFTFRDKKGYFEDRRPASNMDPYVVTSMIFETTNF